MTKILTISGSIREGSYNKKLATHSANILKQKGYQANFIDLTDYEMPLFNEDIEKAGTPENVIKLKKLFVSYDVFVISCPEYNSSITPLLKNTIDWLSRDSAGIKALEVFRDKICLLLSASPGSLGGLRGLVHVRDILGNIGCIVMPEQLALPNCHEIFNDKGEIKDVAKNTMLENMLVKTANFASKVKE